MSKHARQSFCLGLCHLANDWRLLPDMQHPHQTPSIFTCEERQLRGRRRPVPRGPGVPGGAAAHVPAEPAEVAEGGAQVRPLRAEPAGLALQVDSGSAEARGVHCLGSRVCVGLHYVVFTLQLVAFPLHCCIHIKTCCIHVSLRILLQS